MKAKLFVILMFTISISLTLFTVSPTLAQDALPEGWLMITADDVIVRQGPDIGFNRIGVANHREVFHWKGVDTTNFWMHVEYNNTSGWMLRKYTTMSGDMPISQVEFGQGRVRADRLNVRESPNYKAPIIGLVERGKLLQLTGRDDSGEWVCFETSNGQTGWVARAFVNIGDEAFFVRLPLHSRVSGVGINYNQQPDWWYG